MDYQKFYKAGLCNIGDKEVIIRKKVFTFFLLITLVMTLLSINHHHHIWMIILLFSSFFFTVLLWLEIRFSFCIFFGLFNLFNFSNPGNLENVNDPEHCKKDRIKSLKLISFSFILAALFTYIDYKMVCYICE